MSITEINYLPLKKKNPKVYDCATLEEVAVEVKKQLDSESKKTQGRTKVVTLYAFNSTGKTRLGGILTDEAQGEGDELVVLCYNAFLEDMFTWDNEEYVLHFNPNSWIATLVVEQGLDGQIVDNFRDLVSTKIEPSFNFEEGLVTFTLASGDNASTSNIKISKAEESMLIWSIFYTILEVAMSELQTEQSKRTTTVFDTLQYVIVDDPVSSIDDTRLITMAVKLSNAILESNGLFKVMITTHHALFYNVLVNTFRREKNCSLSSYRLSLDNYEYKLTEQGDTPFAYHVVLKEIIQHAIDTNSIEKYHFNLFRNILEKTATFFGYTAFSDCILGANKEEFTRLLNLYSHSRLAELEAPDLSSEDKVLFQESFTRFIENFHWK